MNYERILSKAWQIVSKYKPLWFLGFLAGLVIGTNSNSLGNNFVAGGAWIFQNFTGLLGAQSLIAALLLGLAIAFWLIGTVARIRLVSEVAAVDTLMPKSGVSSSENTRSAAKYVLPILLMQLVLWLPILGVNLVLSRIGQPMSESFIGSAQTGTPPTIASFGVIWVLGMGLAILMFLVSFIDAFAYRSIILEGLGSIRGVQRAMHVIRTNVKSILILSLICLVIGVIVSFVIGLILMPLAWPILRPMLTNLSQCVSGQDYRAMLSCVQQQSTNPTFVVASLLLSVVGAALSALWVAFQSATFTVAYSRLTGVRSSNNLSGAELTQRTAPATPVNELPVKAKTSENKKPAPSKRRTKHR
jgi:hypothetical protein